MAGKIWDNVYVDTAIEIPITDDIMGKTTETMAEHCQGLDVITNYIDGLFYVYSDHVIDYLELVVEGVEL